MKIQPLIIARTLAMLFTGCAGKSPTWLVGNRIGVASGAEQAATLKQRFSGLTEAVTQTKQAGQRLLQERDITALKGRLNAVEKERFEKRTNG